MKSLNRTSSPEGRLIPRLASKDKEVSFEITTFQ